MQQEESYLLWSHWEEEERGPAIATPVQFHVPNKVWVLSSWQKWSTLVSVWSLPSPLSQLQSLSQWPDKRSELCNISVWGVSSPWLVPDSQTFPSSRDSWGKSNSLRFIASIVQITTRKDTSVSVEHLHSCQDRKVITKLSEGSEAHLPLTVKTRHLSLPQRKR